MYISFPPSLLTEAQKQDYDRNEQLAKQFFEKDDKCRDLVRGQKWNEAEKPCEVLVRIVDQLPSGRALERLEAYQLFGHVLRGQKRYQEALGYYNRALDAVASELIEENDELGRLYGDIAITQHLMRDLGRARESYRKAEKIYQLAYASLGDGYTDKWVERTKQGYIKSLKQLIEYHLIAAKDAGATSQIEEIKKLVENLP